MSTFEKLNEALDQVTLHSPDDWLQTLQSVRKSADDHLEAGNLRPSQWSEIVSRSAKIQDHFNGD